MHVKAFHESWPLKKAFTISRGSKTAADVIVVEIAHEGIRGRGEAVSYKHYGESIVSSLQEIEEAAPFLKDRHHLLTLMKPGAARNAVDAAMIDYECKSHALRAWQLLNLKAPQKTLTAYTISMDAPQKMHDETLSVSHYPLLKIKIGLEQGLEQIEAVRSAAPHAKLIVDANEALDFEALKAWMPSLAAAKVDLLEQPLKAGSDDCLKGFKSMVPLCADESCRSIDDLPYLKERYAYINIKLDKTGGLTHAIDVMQKAQQFGLRIMVGSMVGTSLSAAPAMMLAAYADFVDLDGPLLLQKDRENGLFHEGTVYDIPSRALWG